MISKIQLIVCILSVVRGLAQGCIGGTAQYDVYMNNYHTRYLSDADMFWDFTSGNARTYIPKNSNSPPVFAAGLWIGGYNQNSLRTAAATYRQNGLDFWSGPIDTTTTGTNAISCNDYNTFFTITRSQVNNQKNHVYNSGNMPAQITNWPANPMGSTESYKLAPYEDVNHNRIYDPLNGDYPIMWGDYSIYQIINDVGNVHHESQSIAQFGFEIHATHYYVDCPNDSALWNTMFTHYDIINRSSNTYDSLHVAMWLDFNLGNYADDYIGCDTNLNLFYVYNGDGYDEDEGPYTGYHQYLPAFGGLFLNKKMSSFTSYNNTSTSGPISNTPIPYTSHTYYGLMNGLFENGDPMYLGGDGTTGTQTTKYLYPGNLIANTGWTEVNALQTPRNQNGIGATGPYTLNPHDTIKLDFAYIFARDYQHPNDSIISVTKLKQYAQSIQNYYNTNSTPCGSTFTNIKQQQQNKPYEATIYPNPTNNSFSIKSNSTEKNIVQLFDIDGKLVLSQEIIGETSVSTSNLNEGVYIVTIMSRNEFVTKKLVILR